MIENGDMEGESGKDFVEELQASLFLFLGLCRRWRCPCFCASARRRVPLERRTVADGVSDVIDGPTVAGLRIFFFVSLFQVAV